MLVLNRRIGERILIGQDILIAVCRVDGHTVSIGINAPDDVKIIREELLFVQKKSDREIKQPHIKYKKKSIYSILDDL